MLSITLCPGSGLLTVTDFCFCRRKPLLDSSEKQRLHPRGALSSESFVQTVKCLCLLPLCIHCTCAVDVKMRDSVHGTGMVGAVRTDTAQMWEGDKPQPCRRDKINAPSPAPASCAQSLSHRARRCHAQRSVPLEAAADGFRAACRRSLASYTWACIPFALKALPAAPVADSLHHW